MDRDDASCPQDQAAPAVGLADGFGRFGAYTRRIAQDQRLDPRQSATDRLPRLPSAVAQSRRRLPVVPVDDRSRQGGRQIEIDVLAMQVEQVQPEPAGGLQDPFVEGTAKPRVGFPVEQVRRGMLDGIEDSLDADLAGSLDKPHRRPGDFLQTGQDALRLSL